MNVHFEELCKDYCDDKIVPFIGAGMSVPFDIPNWGDLIREITSKYAIGELEFVKHAVQQDLNRYDYWKAINALKQYASVQEEDIQEYIATTIKPKNKKIEDDSIHNYSDLKDMNFKLFLSTNYESILHKYLECELDPILLKDIDFNTQTLFNEKRVCQLHGTISNWGSIVISEESYRKLYNDKKYENILSLITGTKRILFLGFSFDDQFIRTLIKEHREFFKTKHYIILADPTAEKIKELREEYGLLTIPYSTNNSSHIREIRKILTDIHQSKEKQEMTDLENEKKKAHIQDITESKPKQMEKNIEKSWIPINEDIISAPVSKDLSKAYYEGHPLSWNIVRNGYTANRKITIEILKYLDKDFFQAVLISGAGGEGKTTVMYQVALSLYEKGYLIYYFNKDNMINKKISLDFSPKEASVFLIDDATEISNLSVPFSFFRNYTVPIKIIMTARQNEWVSNEVLRSLSSEHLKYLKTFKIAKIDRDEAENIAQLLIKNEATVINSTISELANHLIDQTNGFLLAAMLTATKGKKLESIIYDILRKISIFEDGQNLLYALAIVSLIENIGWENKESSSCSIMLFSKLLNIKKEELRKYTLPLTGEVIFQTFGSEVTTRHESIAAIIYSILFDSSNDYYEEFFLDEEFLYKKLLYAVGDISRENPYSKESSWLSKIPEYLYEEKGYEVAAVYYKIALNQNRLRNQTWVDYIHFQQKEGYLGDIYTLDSAVQLCYELCMELSNATDHIWRVWIEIEENRGNLGNVNKPYSAIWIAKEGSLKRPSSGELWRKWAYLEKNNGNVGTVHKENSSRWIVYNHLFRYGNNSSAVFKYWIDLERELNNIGTVDQEYSARWVAKHIVGKIGAPECWIVWFEIEFEQNNIGEIEVEYSARWILKQAIENCARREIGIRLAWAKLEWELGNIGDVEKECTGRWILSQGTQIAPDISLFLAWAKLEWELGYIGDVKKENSARWIFHQGILIDRKMPLYSIWGEKEGELNNLGTIEEMYTARWLFYNGAIENGYRSVSIQWAELEYRCKNIGNLDTKHSARWLMWKVINEDIGKEYYWMKFILMEYSIGNVGSKLEPCSAVWIYDQWIRNNPEFIEFKYQVENDEINEIVEYVKQKYMEDRSLYDVL